MLEKSPLCHSNLVNTQKENKNIIKCVNFQSMKFDKNYIYYLGFYKTYFYLVLSHKDEKKGGFTHKNAVTTKD